MKSSSMVVEVKNARGNVVGPEVGPKTTTGSGNLEKSAHLSRRSVGDEALQKIKKYEAKYLRKIEDVGGGGSSESGPEASLESSEVTSRVPKFNSGLLGNIKFADFSDSESVSEILSDLGKDESQEKAAESLSAGEESGGIVKPIEEGSETSGNSPSTVTEVNAGSSSGSNYLQGRILTMENLKLDESDEDKPEEGKSRSYSESFEDVAERTATEVDAESGSFTARPKQRDRSQKGRKILRPKLKNKSTQTVSRGARNPADDSSHVDTFLFSNLIRDVSVEDSAHFDVSREVLKQQVALTKHYIACQRSMYSAYCQAVRKLDAHYKPVTLKDTQRLIREHRRSRHKEADSPTGRPHL